jgi:hypothetical protein
MDKNSKILIIVFVIVIVVSVFFTYKRAFIERNYEVIPVAEDSQDEF